MNVIKVSLAVGNSFVENASSIFLYIDALILTVYGYFNCRHRSSVCKEFSLCYMPLWDWHFVYDCGSLKGTHWPFYTEMYRYYLDSISWTVPVSSTVMWRTL